MVEIAKSTKPVTRTVVEDVPVFNIQLSEPEAKALRAILARVGGSERGPRGVASELFDGLRGPFEVFDFAHNDKVSNGHVMLCNTWEEFLDG